MGQGKAGVDHWPKDSIVLANPGRLAQETLLANTPRVGSSLGNLPRSIVSISQSRAGHAGGARGSIEASVVAVAGEGGTSSGGGARSSVGAGGGGTDGCHISAKPVIAIGETGRTLGARGSSGVRACFIHISRRSVLADINIARAIVSETFKTGTSLLPTAN